METKAVAKPLRAAQSGSEPEQIGLAPEPEPLDQLSHWSRAVSGPSQAMTTLSLCNWKKDQNQTECNQRQLDHQLQLPHITVSLVAGYLK